MNVLATGVSRARLAGQAKVSAPASLECADAEREDIWRKGNRVLVEQRLPQRALNALRCRCLWVADCFPFAFLY